MHRSLKSPVAIAFSLALLASAAVAIAQSSLNVSQNAEYGPHLVTDSGRSVYLYVEDQGGESACVDACTRNWPPLAAGADEVALGEGADPALLGTITRPDGTSQVTYAGNPLYTFARDTDEGTTRGQGLGGAFFLVSPAGEAVTEKLPQQRTEVEPELYDALMADGAKVYTSNCAVCHGANGEGGIGVKLAANSQVGNAAYVVERVLNGFIEHGMPPFRAALDDHQVAAVATYVRDSWGNDFGPVTEEEVAAER